MTLSLHNLNTGTGLELAGTGGDLLDIGSADWEDCCCGTATATATATASATGSWVGTATASAENCTLCDKGLWNYEYQIVVDGIVNDSCNQCINMNGTFVVLAHSVNACQSNYTLPSELCLGHFETLRLVLVDVGATYELRGFWFGAGFSGGVSIDWVLDLGASKPNCQNWVDLELPFDTQHTHGYCDGSSATFKVTSM